MILDLRFAGFELICTMKEDKKRERAEKGKNIFLLLFRMKIVKIENMSRSLFSHSSTA
jgi:hypothetical protein